MVSDRLLYEQTPALLLTTDADGNLTVVSDQWLATLGYCRTEVLGHAWQKFCVDTATEPANNWLHECQQFGQVRNWPVLFRTRTGQNLPVSLTANRVWDEANKTFCYLANLTEVSSDRPSITKLTTHSTKDPQDSSWLTDKPIESPLQRTATWSITSPNPMDGDVNAGTCLITPQDWPIWLSPAEGLNFSPVDDLKVADVDACDRQQTKLALQSSQQFLQLVLDNMPQRVFWKDLNGRFLGCNRSFAKDMGQTDPAEVVGKTDAELLSLTSESIQIFQEHDQAVLAADQALVFENDDGNIKWVSTTKLPLKTEAGELLGIFGCYQDITERVLARESLKCYARMIEAATDAIGLIDSAYRHRIVNNTYQEWYGNGSKTVLGCTVAELLGQDTFENRWKHLIDRCLQGERIRYNAWCDASRSGRRFCSVSMSPFIDADGNIEGAIIVIRDLTALKESETRFQRLVTNMPGIICRYHLDLEGRDRFSYLSIACRDIWELEPQAAVDDIAQFWQLVHPEDGDQLRQALLQSRSRLTPLAEDYRIVTPSGIPKWLKLTARPYRDAQGECLWDGIIIDISEQKATQQALQASETLNQAILEALPDLLVRMSKDGVCLKIQHPSNFPILLPDAEIIGRNVCDVLPPALFKQRMADIEQAIATQQTQVSEYQLSVNGQMRWEESRIVPLTDDEVLVLIRDIDERRQAEEEIHRLNQVLAGQKQHLEELVELRTAELMTLMNALPDQIFVVDRAQNQMVFGNSVVAQFAQKKNRKDFEGRDVYDCFCRERATYYDAQNQQVFETGEILHVEESVDTDEGIVYLDTYKIPLKRPDGEVYALIGTSRDITELVKAHQALKAQAAQLAITNQELQSFSYSISHDLRAPLRHISGFIAALKKHLKSTTAYENPKILHYIDVIESSSQKMGHLIDGLLMLSRVGRREMVLRPVPLEPLVEQAIALIEVSAADAQRLQIHIEALPTVQGDSVLLQQVFTNLIHNAVKFSRDRSPAIIRIGQREDGALFVADNGVGFDMAYADKLFSPFQRLHREKDFPGTGIGLAIVSRIIHRHGGHIWAESGIGQGTTFCFTLSVEL